MSRRSNTIRRILASLSTVIILMGAMPLESFASNTGENTEVISEISLNTDEDSGGNEEANTAANSDSPEGIEDANKSGLAEGSGSAGTSSAQEPAKSSGATAATEEEQADPAEGMTDPYEGESEELFTSESSTLLATKDIPVLMNEKTPKNNDPVYVLSANNWFRVDPTNAVVKTPEDFAVGKKGAYEFAFSFKFTPADIPQDMYESITAVFTIPAGFTVSKLSSLADIKITNTVNPDGSTTVVCKAGSVGTTAFLGQISVKQDAEKLLDGLQDSQGEYIFDMQIFTDYGTPDENEVHTKEEPDLPVSRITLNADLTSPEWTIEGETNNDTWNPGEITAYDWNIWNGRAVIGSWGNTTSAADDAKGYMSTDFPNYFRPKKPIVVSFHKSEGYLPEITTLHMALPKEGYLFDPDGGAWIVSYKTDAGEEKVLPAEYGQKACNNFLVYGSKLADRMEGSDYASPVSGKSWTDLFYQAGTFTFKLSPIVYYNRLYQGDWSSTRYEAEENPYVEFTKPGGETEKTEGDPVVFNFVQGGETVSLDKQNDLYTGVSNLTEIAQYKDSGGDYNDSELLTASLNFTFNQDFKIMDDLVLSYDYEEALSPVKLGNLRSTKVNGFTYRIFITDAKTGQVSRIETIVDEESFANGYTPKTVNGVTETVIDGSKTTQWSLPEADNAGNKLYVSRIEVCKTEYEYNVVGAPRSPIDTSWFNYVLRAYHHRLSNGEDIPDKYPAKIKRELTAVQIEEQGGPLSKDYTVLTLHQKDNIELVPNQYSFGEMEVNDHEVTGLYRSYSVKKYSDTMKYNVGADGKTIKFGEEGYDPVIIELSGDAVTMVDRMNRNNQRLLAIVGPDGIFYDLNEKGIDPEQYIVHGDSRYGEGVETVVSKTTHSDNGGTPYQTDLYKIDEICKALGIPYAQKMVAAVDQINDWIVPNNYINTTLEVYVHNVKPGHMNYDGVIGAGGSADLPKELKLSGVLYCQYSDYKNEKLDGQVFSDGNGGDISHGPKKKYEYKAAKFIEGVMPTGISVTDYDYYVNPYSAVQDARGTVVNRQSLIPAEDRICNVIAQQSKPTAALPELLELTKIKVTTPQGTQMQYKNAVIDFAGTDPKLLSLANTISVDKLGWMQMWNLKLEYTLSTGETKSLDVQTIQNWVHPIDNEPRSHYLIPGVDIENGIYLTSLKVILPNNKNWGGNAFKWADGVNDHQSIPSIGLGMYNVNIPARYPGTDIAVGSVSDNDNDAEYDKLTVKAALKFDNIYGEDKTTGNAAYTAIGASERIAALMIKVHKLWANNPALGATTVNQGEILNVNTPLSWDVTPNTKAMLVTNDVRVRPTFYYKIDPAFTYIDGSSGIRDYGKDEDLTVQFFRAGTDAGESGTEEYGILKISYNDADYDRLFSANKDKPDYSSDWNRNYIRFKLRTDFSAEPGVRKPVIGVWMDTQIDANRDGNGGNESGITVETVNDNNQLKDNAPKSNTIGNETAAKDTDQDGNAEMLYLDFSMTVKINEQAVQGIAPYAIAQKPYQEDPETVSSRDITAVENLFSEKVFMSGNDQLLTKDWEVFIPVMKKDEAQKYIYKNHTTLTEKNDFSVDFMDIDTSDLDNKTLTYNVYYTTDQNPAKDAYQGAQNASWTLFKSNDPAAALEALPADLSQISMIKVTVDEIKVKEKVFFELKYKLHEHKSVIGKLTSQNAFYANFCLDGQEKPFFGENGQSGKPLEYNLLDMELKGFVWNETDYNSTYDNGADTKVKGAEMLLFEKDGRQILQKNNNEYKNNRRNITDANGQYTLIMPHDGEWDVKIVLPSGKKLVRQNVNGDPAIDSVFDRNTQMADAEFAADAVKKLYTLTNVNAGIYDQPIIKILPADPMIHVTDTHTGQIKVEITNRVPGTTAALSVKASEQADIAVMHDLGNETADFDGLKTGVVKCEASIDDGYGGKITEDFKATVYGFVKYDSNTGTGSVNDDKKYYPSTEADGTDAGTDEVTVKKGDVLKRTGYIFDGWNTKADGTGTDHSPDSTFKTGPITEDITLYAKWKPITYYIEFKPNTVSVNGKPLHGNVTGTMTDRVMAYDKAENLTPNAYSIPGYDFAGWNTKADGKGDSYADKQSVKNLTDKQGGKITLYAQWTPHKYTVKYDKNAGSAEGTTPDSEHVYGVESKLTKNGYINDGYYFAGWSIDQDSDTVEYTDQALVKDLTQVKDGTVTLYAVWSECKPAVSDPPVSKKITGSITTGKATFKFIFTAEENTLGLAKMPMPEGAVGNQSYVVTKKGSGAIEFGNITFTKPGTYVYSIKEVNTKAEGYTYDSSVIKITYTVKQEGKKLVVSRDMTRNGKPADNAVFVNRYTPEKPEQGEPGPSGPDYPKKPGEPSVQPAKMPETVLAMPAVPQAVQPSLTAPKTPAGMSTGDESDIFLWLIIMIISSGALAAYMLWWDYDKKKV